MKKVVFLMVLCTLFGLTKTVAQQAYAIFDTNSKLTFYYDNNSSSRTGTRYSINLNKTDDEDPAWTQKAGSVVAVEFDPSFAAARPTNTGNWFGGMYNLTTIIGMEYLNTSQVTSMIWMFAFCSKLRSLDLTHFDTPKLRKTSWMFYGCKNLVTICVGDGWTTASISNSESMFIGCHSLVGGEGHKYDDMYALNSRARIDGKDGQAGYFTSAEYASKKYNLWVGGTQVTYMNKEDIFNDVVSEALGGEPRVSYDPTSQTLTLNYYQLEGKGKASDASTGYGAGIYSEINGLTINMKGNASAQGVSGAYGLYLKGNTTITGDYKLTAKGDIGVDINAGELTVGGNATLEAEGIGENSMGIIGYMSIRPSITYYTTLTIKDKATVSAKGTAACIARLKNLVFENHEITSLANAVWNASKNGVYNTDDNVIKERWVNIEYKEPSRADVNGDGMVDSADIVAVIKEMK